MLVTKSKVHLKVLDEFLYLTKVGKCDIGRKGTGHDNCNYHIARGYDFRNPLYLYRQ